MILESAYLCLSANPRHGPIDYRGILDVTIRGGKQFPTDQPQLSRTASRSWIQSCDHQMVSLNRKRTFGRNHTGDSLRSTCAMRHRFAGASSRSCRCRVFQRSSTKTLNPRKSTVHCKQATILPLPNRYRNSASSMQPLVKLFQLDSYLKPSTRV